MLLRLRPSSIAALPSRRAYYPATTRCLSTTKSVGAANAPIEEEHPHIILPPTPMIPFPQTPKRAVPPHIDPPPYAATGFMPIHHAFAPDTVLIHDEGSIRKMRNAARLARKILDFACSLAQPGVTTDAIDAEVHRAIIAEKAYPSPLNYAGFPKSVCSSINEVICHGIPDMRPLEVGDVVSFDVSCFLNGVHGDNCATVIVGDDQDTVGAAGVDWRGVPYRMDWNNDAELEARVVASRRLVHAAREGLYASIDVCKPGACLSEVGRAIHAVADEYGFDTVKKYRGHGIAHVFHTAPYVKVRSLLSADICIDVLQLSGAFQILKKG